MVGFGGVGHRESPKAQVLLLWFLLACFGRKGC